MAIVDLAVLMKLLPLNTYLQAGWQAWNFVSSKGHGPVLQTAVQYGGRYIFFRDFFKLSINNNLIWGIVLMSKILHTVSVATKHVSDFQTQPKGTFAWEPLYCYSVHIGYLKNL